MTVLAHKSTENRVSGLWTADQFLDFCMTRPDEEHWQLVDGLAMMMVPPTYLHQKLGKNMLLLIDTAVSRSRPDLEVLYEMGVRVPGVDDFNPEPDLLVVEADAPLKRYADKFFLIAEVISPSNTAEMIERKIELYRSHPENLYCLTIDQDSVHVALWARDSDWARTDLRSLGDTLRLPAIGLEVKLADIYKGTPLAR
jgi:Uma2 family endonuclease